MRQSSEMLKGVLDGCVLSVMVEGESYGYLITRRLQELGLPDIAEGTVYAVLMRLEKDGLIDYVKKPSPLGPNRKYYSVNDAGHRRLAAFWDDWDSLVSLLDNMRNL